MARCARPETLFTRLIDLVNEALVILDVAPVSSVRRTGYCLKYVLKYGDWITSTRRTDGMSIKALGMSCSSMYSNSPLSSSSQQRIYSKLCFQLSKETTVSSLVNCHCFGALLAMMFLL